MNALTDFINVLLNGEFPLPVRNYFRRQANQAKSMSYTLHLLITKCANSHDK